MSVEFGLEITIENTILENVAILLSCENNRRVIITNRKLINTAIKGFLLINYDDCNEDSMPEPKVKFGIRKCGEYGTWKCGKFKGKFEFIAMSILPLPND